MNADVRIFDPNELEKRIDEVLYYVWDPIGVSDSPYARGEYSSYVPGILQLIFANSPAEKISSHLTSIVRMQMGLIPNEERERRVADLILQHKDAIDNGFA